MSLDLPLGTRPPIHIAPPSTPQVSWFKWAYFDMVQVWGREIFMHVVQKHTHETLLLWRVVHAL